MSQLAWRNLVKEGFGVVLFLSGWFLLAAALIGGGAALLGQGVQAFQSSTAGLQDMAPQLAGGAMLVAAGLAVAAAGGYVVLLRLFGKSVALGVSAADVGLAAPDDTDVTLGSGESPAIDEGDGPPSELPEGEADEIDESDEADDRSRSPSSAGDEGAGSVTVREFEGDGDSVDTEEFDDAPDDSSASDSTASDPLAPDATDDESYGNPFENVGSSDDS